MSAITATAPRERLTPPALARSQRTLGGAAIRALAVTVAVALVATAAGACTDDGTPPMGSLVAHRVAVTRVVPVAGTRMGAWVRPRDETTSPEAKRREVERLEALLGRRLDVVGDFATFDLAFPNSFDRWVVASGRTLLMSWNGTSAGPLLAGDHDDLIRARARSLRDLRAPILLRFWWEMDVSTKEAWAEPEEFIAAWHHVRGVFAEEGASNVVWVWAPTASAFTSGEADRWFPGRDAVDLAGADGYDFAPVRPGAEHRSVVEVFGPFARWARRHRLPAMIPEIGALEDGPAAKADWIASLGPALEGPLRGIGTVVWFDSRRWQEGLLLDWRLDSTPASAAAVRALGARLAGGLDLPGD